MFNSANPTQQQSSTTAPAPQQFRPQNFMGVDTIPVNPPTKQPPTFTGEQMRMRNPTNYGGIYDELSGGSTSAVPPHMMNPNMPPENFNPYTYAGIQPQSQQVPVPNTNVDPVAEYARMINGGSRPIEGYQQVRVIEEQPQYTHEVITQEQQQQEEEEYRNYTPKDFDKLSPDQLEEAYQKGQQSLESIQSYLASVSQKRNEKMRSAGKPMQQQQSTEQSKES